MLGYLLALQRIYIGHFYFCVLIILHTYLIFEYLTDYVFNMPELSVVHSAANVDFGNRILKPLNGIRLPLLSVPVL